MTILVTGATGAVGSQVVHRLVEEGASVRAIARSPEKANLPASVDVRKGDMTDIASMRAALEGVDTLFLLNAVVADEVTQAILTLSLARDAGIQRIVYFSVFNSDRFTDVPHFTGKYTVERMIEEFDLPATILRPSYFIQNDASMKEVIAGKSVYPMPVGSVGVSMADTRDIAEIAAISLLQRERSATPLPREVIDVVGPQAMTGSALAAIWTEVLGKPVNYGGDDLDAFEAQMASRAPSWMARDIRLMLGRFQRDGMAANERAVARMTELLGRPPRSYRDFAVETAKEWATK
ncbi:MULTISPECIES: SDR family oxidoreductase [Burkholderiaceae]|uniref:Oxidoreductase n=1 Tax=Caballeronia sordidicola TaxID=196367 RepID=A0A242M312_CABSO|nr:MULTISPECIES: NmrA/HSCARG family protein [Burkholderiaceae]AMH43548.1 NmrA family transcriptional regulator [Burkholderia sp. PAMC 26561]OTP65325.1 Oxidoreductase [Caballeronia sordidicola]